ncbi:hypothetical protein J3R30DRAFT_3294392 [Lentinula aciculospora]|uniref:Uncharacterized protein n=1 Tax=Lentinula aciculospora TaxID=153920 RepID=A0A9W9A7H5_9AGAR|nr:hypothetical protein J3R30DRAFT_3294392 [Lentinula aciculospora]
MISARSIHIPAFTGFVSPASGGTAKRIVLQARTILSRFVGHLIAPGLPVHSPASFQHAVRGSAPGRMSSIKERMSFSARHVLSRPAQPHFFPRVPTFVSRSVTQVGLGTARNFSSGRSVFQNLVENVPIAGRALYEADWEVSMRKERAAMTKKIFNNKVSKSSHNEMLKTRDVFASISLTELVPELMDHYFATPTTPSVTTVLLIPLAPTPTSRVPLPSNVSEHPTFLPLPTLASIHNSHELHSLRVSALFSRLDVAKVWERGVLCSAYSQCGSEHGVCTVLKIEFVGWTIAEVRGVIGESGSGWCALEEVVTESQEDGEEDIFSDASSLLSDISGGESTGSPFTVEPAQSLILPTLDFSSSFVYPPLPIASNRLDIELDPWADSSDDSWIVDHNHLEFSSDFVSRLDTRQSRSSSV